MRSREDASSENVGRKVFPKERQTFDVQKEGLSYVRYEGCRFRGRSGSCTSIVYNFNSVLIDYDIAQSVQECSQKLEIQ